MIVDQISPGKLPDLVVWLDWNFHACFDSFTVCMVLSYLYMLFKISPHITFGSQITALFVGFCLWVVYIAIFKGYAVG